MSRWASPSRETSQTKMAGVQRIFDRLDPFKLKQTIETKLRMVQCHQAPSRLSPAA
jgi:hypothetical protein